MSAPIKMKYSDYQKIVENGGQILPKTDYNFTQNFGNDQAMLKAITPIAQKAGYVRDDNMANSHFRKADEYEMLNSVKPVGLADRSAKKTNVSGGGGYSYTPISYNALSNIAAFTPSQEYLDAMAYTQTLLDKLNSGRTSYSDKVDEMMDKIANREQFSYDFETDPLFQNALASSMAAGQTAMENTIGAASGLTGGYGSSYATSAGNQAYNDYVKQAYEQLPEYYKLALDAYEREGNEMYNQLGMYRSADDTEYNRNATAYSANYQQAQDMYNREYNNYWDTANANLAIDKYNNDAAMEAAQFNATQALNAAKFNYQKQQDALDRASASKNGASGTSYADLSDTQLNNIKKNALSVAEKNGADSQAVAEYIQLQESIYGELPDNLIKDIYSYVDSNVSGTKLSLQNKNGNYVYTDQYGKPYQGADRTLVKVKSSSTKGNDEYQDSYGNTYTESQLKAMYGSNWKDYVK